MHHSHERVAVERQQEAALGIREALVDGVQQVGEGQAAAAFFLVIFICAAPQRGDRPRVVRRRAANG
jgi:hypothetical protein